MAFHEKQVSLKRSIKNHLFLWLCWGGFVVFFVLSSVHCGAASSTDPYKGGGESRAPAKQDSGTSRETDNKSRSDAGRPDVTAGGEPNSIPEHAEKPETAAPSSERTSGRDAWDPPTKDEFFKKRACPGDFQGSASPFPSSAKPCSGNAPQKECLQTACIPTEQPSTEELKDFATRCKDPKVLCVGSKFPTKTLKEAKAIFLKDKKIETILLSAEIHLANVTFSGLQRALTIEGQSNDPKKGTLIATPPPTKTSAQPHAALRFESAQNLTFKRLVFSGDGHGLYIKKANEVTLSQTLFRYNRLSGAWLEELQKVRVEKSHFLANGAISVIINHDYRPNGVIINHDYRPKGVIINHDYRTNSVIINHDYRKWGRDGVSVIINHDYRKGNFLRNIGGPYEKLRYGLVILKSKNSEIHGSIFEKNGAGGVRISSTEKLGVIINHDYRVLGDGQVGVIINHDYRVAMTGNMFYKNGPVSRANARTAKACSACPSGTFCEGGMCHKNLLLGPKDKNAGAMLGVGAVVAGIGTVEVKGNSFFSNDASGLLLHSAKSVKLQQNAFERNGVRAFVPMKKMREFAFASARIWGVEGTVEVFANSILDGASHGLHISHQPKKSHSLPFTFSGNYVAGSGRFLPRDVRDVGDGIRVNSTGNVLGMELTGSQNYFENNRRSGFFSQGAVFGRLSKNSFGGHPNRALVFHNVSKVDGKKLTIHDNKIIEARGYGVQFFLGNADIILSKNTIENVRALSRNLKNAEADALHFNELKSVVTMFENQLTGNFRAGVFLHGTTGKMSQNTISGSPFSVITQHNGSVVGQDNKKTQLGGLVFNSKELLPHKKDF